MSEQATTNERMATILALDPSARLAFDTGTDVWYVESSSGLSGRSSDSQPGSVHYASAALAVTIFLHHLQHPSDGGRVFTDDGTVRRYSRWDEKTSSWETLGERASSRSAAGAAGPDPAVTVFLVGAMDGDDARGGLNVDAILTDREAAEQLARTESGDVYEVPLDVPGRLVYGDDDFVAGTWERFADGRRFIPAGVRP